MYHMEKYYLNYVKKTIIISVTFAEKCAWSVMRHAEDCEGSSSWISLSYREQVAEQFRGSFSPACVNSV